MPVRKVKKKEHEKLSDANIKHVIELLEAEKPITKKEACEILNISYNTTRLEKIISEWRSDREYREKRKAEKKGKPASKDEIATIVESYLDGDPIAEISKRLYRSPTFIKNIIDTVGVPSRQKSTETHLIPEACMAEEFSPGEIAWSATYDSPCEVRKKLEEKYVSKYTVPCYQVWIKKKIQSEEAMFGVINGGFNAFVPAYDLAKLSHLLEQYGVDLSRV